MIKTFSLLQRIPFSACVFMMSATLMQQTIAAQTSHPPVVEAQKQVAGFYQHQFGPYQITALLDGTNYLNPNLFKGLQADEVEKILKKYYADQAKGIQTSVNAFLVNTGSALYLMDSGASSCFGAHLGSIYNNLKASGHLPEQVNGVFLTHLHPDHVCGISQNGQAQYPNATLHIAKTEYDFWLNPETVKTLPKEKQAGFLATVEKIKAALKPYEDAKKIQVFSDKALRFDQVGFKPSHGHTPGHYSFSLEHENQRLVFIGDIVHSHTLQFEKPETAIEFDLDAKAAVATRLKHFSEYAQTGQTIAAAHLPFPGIGHIYSENDKQYQWIPIHFKD